MNPVYKANVLYVMWNIQLFGVLANIKSRTCRIEIRSATTAASMLRPSTAMAHNTKYTKNNVYYGGLLQRETKKRGNDEHNSLYLSSYLMN